MVIHKNDLYYVIVKGVYMTELVNNEWQLCEFNTKEDAEQELNNYNKFWERV